MLTVRRTETHGGARAASVRFQLLMCKCRFPMVDDGVDSRRFCKSRGRGGICPSSRSEANHTREMRFMVVEIGLQSLQSDIIRLQQ